MKKNVTQRKFICPKCNTIHVAYKKSCKRTKAGHIKRCIVGNVSQYRI